MKNTLERSIRRWLRNKSSQGLLVSAAVAVLVGTGTAVSGLGDLLDQFTQEWSIWSFLLGFVGGVVCLSVTVARQRARQSRLSKEAVCVHRRSERFFRTLIDAIPVLIAFVDTGGRYRISNRGHSKWFGKTPDEMVGQSVRGLMGGRMYEANRRHIQAALSGKRVTFEGPLQKANGDLRYAERSYIPSIGEDGAVEGYFVCVKDITERKQREEAILQTKREISDIFEALQEGFALFDEEDRLVVSNQNYARFFPSIAELIQPGAKFEDLIHAAADRGQNVDALRSREEWIEKRMAAHKRPGSGFEHRFSDGRAIWVEEQKTGDGKTLATYVDITRIRQRESELHQARNKAQLAEAAKSQFLGNVNHELRTPLNAILGFSEIISQQVFGPVESHYVSYANDINLSGAHLLEIINNLLDLSKLESGDLVLSESEIDVSDVLHATRRLLSLETNKHGINVSIRVPSGMSRLWADPARLKQLLMNLMTCAVKYTPSGGSVELSAAVDEEQKVTLRVTDDGAGMSEQEIAVALEPFGHVDRSYTRDHQGTYLGLPLAKSLIELHGGKLTVESTKGMGTTMIVTMPAERTRPRPEALPAAALAEADDQISARPKAQSRT